MCRNNYYLYWHKYNSQIATKIYVKRGFLFISLKKDDENYWTLLLIPLEEIAYPSHAMIANFRWSFDEFVGI